VPNFFFRKKEGKKARSKTKTIFSNYNIKEFSEIGNSRGHSFATSWLGHALQALTPLRSVRGTLRFRRFTPHPHLTAIKRENPAENSQILLRRTSDNPDVNFNCRHNYNKRFVVAVLQTICQNFQF
jgi:hypothetical protein